MLRRVGRHPWAAWVSVALAVVLGSVLPAMTPALGAAGGITTVAGNGSPPDSPGQGDGGPATAAPLAYPYGVAFGSNKMFVTESRGDRVRAVDASGTISTFAGGGTLPIGDGGPATNAVLGCPQGVATDSSANVYFSDACNNVVRKIDHATGIITTVAGNGSTTTSGDTGAATSAGVPTPYGLAVDRSDNLFVATLGDRYVIRRIDHATGIITTVAGDGTLGGPTGDGGPATAAEVVAIGLAMGPGGDLFATDVYLNTVRRIVPGADGLITGAADETITTVAGNGTAPYSGDGGPATAAGLATPFDVRTDASGDLYIADQQDNHVRKVIPGADGVVTGAPDEIITTAAGTGAVVGADSGDGGPATAADVVGPNGVVVDHAGNLYISDVANRIRRVDSAGIISTFAGTGTAAFGGDGGPAAKARISNPEFMAFDAGGSLFFADYGNRRIRKVDTAGVITTVAGGYVGDGLPAVSAVVSGPRGLVTDRPGAVFVADCGNMRVRKVDPSGIISTSAGGGAPADGVGDGGQAASAAMECPTGLLTVTSGPAAGTLYVADAGCPPPPGGSTLAPVCLAGNRVRRIDPSGVISTVAGTGIPGYSGDGGQATAAQLSSPSGLTLDGAGNLYIGDTANHRVRKVTPAGVITTVAGNGTVGNGTNGVPATSVPVVSPNGLAFDPAGNLVIAESGFARIRRVDATGVITTIAGNGIPGFSGDGGPAPSSLLNQPTNLAFDTAGNLSFSDQGNLRVRRIEAGSPAPLPIAGRHDADCGKVIVNNTKLKSDIGPCPGDGIIVGADGITLDLNGHNVTGDAGRTGNYAGIRLTGRNKVQVQGGKVVGGKLPGAVSGFDAGVAIIGGSANTVSGVTVANNLGSDDFSNSTFGDGIIIFFSSSNRIVNNVVAHNGLFDGIGMLGAGADKNLIQGNTIYNTTNDAHPNGPVGVGIIINPFLGTDRPRNLSDSGNQIVANTVHDNENAGISTLSNVDGTITDNVSDRNGFATTSPYGGFPGNGIGVRNLLFADPQTRVLVKNNQVRGNARNGIEVDSKSNSILSNTTDGNGGPNAGRYFFDLRDGNRDPITGQPSCDNNIWSANIWGSGGFNPACTTAGGHAITATAAVAPAVGIRAADNTQAQDPRGRRAPPKP